MSTRLSRLAAIQGIYFLSTGIWPLVSMHSFLLVTGPKTDTWLVITVGLLLSVTGAVLSSAGIRNRTQFEFALLGLATAASLASVEIYFSLKGVISAVYLLDTFIEMGFVYFWVSALVGRKSRKEPSPNLPEKERSEVGEGL